MTDEEIEKAAEEWEGKCEHFGDDSGCQFQSPTNRDTRFDDLIRETYIAGFRACQEKMKWISVKEGLPEKGKTVLLLDNFKEMWLGHLGEDGELWYYFGRDVVYGKVFDSWLELPALPEPPEGEAGRDE